MADRGREDSGQNTSSSTPHGDRRMSEKRVAAQQLIERYYYQLTQGCGNDSCTNEHCASSRKAPLSPNQAAVQALDLFARKGKLCVSSSHTPQEESSSLFAPSSDSGEVSSQPLVTKDSLLWAPQQSKTQSLPSSSRSSTSGEKAKANSPPKPTKLTEESLAEILKECTEIGSYSKLVHTLGHIFPNPEFLGQSFIGPLSPKVVSSTPEAVESQLSKEQLRSMEVDEDKEKDSQEPSPDSSSSTIIEAKPNEVISVDIYAVRRAFEALNAIDSSNYESGLIHALGMLAETIELDLKYGRLKNEIHLLNVIVIVFELPWIGTGDYFENVLPGLCRACAFLTVSHQATLVRFWAAHCTSNLRNWVQSLQQLISFRVLSGDFNRDYAVNDEDTITACVKVMRIFYCVNIFASTVLSGKKAIESSADVMETDDPTKDSFDVFAAASLQSSMLSSKQTKTKREDALMTELAINVLDCRKPIVSFADFFNEPLSDAVEMDRDFAYFAAASDSPSVASNHALKISFMNFPFILTPAAKALGLYYDNRIRMFSERRQSIMNSVLNGQPSSPYLKLKIRRDHVIDDALIGLEMVAMENPSELKKQLVVEFEGEQGIDEGGLSKEFFQLVIDQVFNPDYAMFAFNSETRNFWFNPTSFESDAQFTLIGIMLGLAIYNTIILDIHFPMVLYRKLLGRKGTFEDLQEFDPALWKGLNELLEYPDMEDTLMQTFSISYKDVFGVVYNHELKENGASCSVNQNNRQEFVELYADYLLNECIGRQFAAFRRGFAMVTDESPLALLFRPEEVEQLVCGSAVFDFAELQNSTEYDGGFTAQSETIQHFWSVVHDMSTEDKRRLLQFTTGSDRVPVGGLGRLKLIIARNGADSDRLPMAHTCYNVLLLPEYGSKDKLKERLMKAIDYSKGFGML